MKHKQTFSILIWVYRRKTTDKIGTLYARVTVSGIRAEISLSRRINVSSWDDKNSIVKPDCNEATEINEFLDIERGELRQCFYQLRSDNKPITAEAIKLKYLGLEESGGKSLLEAFQYHNDQMKGLVGKNYSLTTYKKCMVTIGKLKRFLTHTYNRTDILLSDLKYKFITDFEYYLRTEHNLSNNSTMGYIKILKKIVKISVNNEWIPKNPFASFVCKIEARERQVLNDSDLEKLKSKKFHSARLEQVRDIFLFSCFTGYAYADVQALTHKHIGIGMDGEKWIFTSRMKTDNRSNFRDAGYLPTARVWSLLNYCFNATYNSCYYFL
ncbi:MAG: site-specific integrase [Cyclobacteriaceae bacterium]|nr:MAG: site-specific integrase [Cyclobacteriaceae bacterium]